MSRPSQHRILVFDVGGTHVRAARFEPATGELVARSQVASPNYLSFRTSIRDGVLQHLLRAMRQLGEQVLAGEEPEIVSIAFPGPIDSAGNALAAPTLFGPGHASPVPIAEACRSLWPHALLLLMNDLTAAGYRYLAPGCRDFCILTIGSGIGHKLFIDGAPQLGPSGRGGEIGHLRVDFGPEAPLCDCGGKGHLSAMASGRGVLNRARARALAAPEDFAASSAGRRCGGDPGRLDNAALVAAALEDDPWAAGLVAEGGRFLGLGLAAIHLAAGTELFILVGGFVSALGERYRSAVVQGARAACWNLGQDWDALVRLGLPDDDHGLIGAGLYAARRLPPRGQAGRPS